LLKLAEIEDAGGIVRDVVPQTPLYNWPLLSAHAGCDVLVKHENHTPIGAFKVRGGLVYMDSLRKSEAVPRAVTSATRGNHGQSIALAAARAGIGCVIYVPHGNSPEKNAAMRAFGATLVEHGRDFDEAKHECARAAREQGLHLVPSFHRELVRGVATYALELFRAAGPLDVVYVPIGMGSGICGVITVRDLLGLKTEVVGVVAEQAPAVALSFATGRIVATPSAATFADGLACREPNEESLGLIRAGAARIATVTEAEIADAIRTIYRATHNAAEGAGAAAFAAIVKERERLARRRVAFVLSGSNIDTAPLARILAGHAA